MLAEKALELIKELQRTIDSTLPPYNVRRRQISLDLNVYISLIIWLSSFIDNARKCPEYVSHALVFIMGGGSPINHI